MRFSERNGIVVRAIQLNDVDTLLRSRIINAINEYIDEIKAKRIVDMLGLEKYHDYSTLFDDTAWNKQILDKHLRSCEWYVLYDAAECVYSVLKTFGARKSDLKDFTKRFNTLFEEEKSGYRFIDEIISPITNEAEISSIKSCLALKNYSASDNIRKALELYSDRKNPNYENSIKESISAVESVCCYITGSTGKGSTLSKTIYKLETNGCYIHPQMRSAILSLYNYTCDEDGIRHGSIDFSNAPAEDAKFMLVICSAFVNYLLEKHSKNTENTENG